MARRKIATIEVGQARVLVQRDAEWDEYRARLYVAGVLQPDADYHTSDKDDALATGRYMAQHAACTVQTAASQ
jgi:hypothetical protein